MNIEMVLKSRSYILVLACVKLSLEIFFISELFNEEFFSPSFRIYLNFNVWPNFTCGTDSCVVP